MMNSIYHIEHNIITQNICLIHKSICVSTYLQEILKDIPAINKLAKARKTRKSLGTLGLKKFEPGKLWVKKKVFC